MARCQVCFCDPCQGQGWHRESDMMVKLFRHRFSLEADALLSLVIDAADALEKDPRRPSLSAVLAALSSMDEEAAEALRVVVSILCPPPGPGRPPETRAHTVLYRTRETLVRHLHAPPFDPDSKELSQFVVAREAIQHPWIARRLTQVEDLLAADSSISEAQALDLAAWSETHGLDTLRRGDAGNASDAVEAAREGLKRARRKSKGQKPR